MSSPAHLANAVMPYAWGSRTVIADLLGEATPSESPQAELWMGAHPNAPSRLLEAAGEVSLLKRIEQEPSAQLGDRVSRRFGSTLPFLLKVLAAETPLSLQAHPSLEQARQGYEREEAAGVPRTAAHRNYKDANHKPELICALTRFEALSGFREVEETLQLFDQLKAKGADGYLAPLRQQPDTEGLRTTFHGIMAAPENEMAPFVQELVAACASHQESAFGKQGRFGRECALAVKLNKLYPNDRGIFGALLLNFIELAPGQALYLDAGNLHAYVDGAGVEIMANSDNVLRGGLTPKHIDVPELLRVLDFKAGAVQVLTPQPNASGFGRYTTPAQEFELQRLAAPQRQTMTLTPSGPEVLLCAEGQFDLSGADANLTLRRGQSAFVPASSEPCELTGSGLLFRALVPDQS